MKNDYLSYLHDLVLGTSQSSKNLKEAYSTVSQAYRSSGRKRLDSLEEQMAYIVGRLPATLGSLERVFEEIPEGIDIQSVADWGCGVGMGSFITLEHFPNLKKATLIDHNKDLLEIYRKFVATQNLPFQVDYHAQSLAKVKLLEPVDLSIAAYVFNEFSQADQLSLVNHLWNQTKRLIILIVPGTPFDFQNLLSIRQRFIEHGGHILAPCPHHQTCPFMGSSEWCHFSARIQRSTHHRSIKGATLPYEDEKYSYLVISKEAVHEREQWDRIVESPLQRKGHIHMRLCTKEGVLSKKIIPSSQKDLYKIARKKEWGDKLP